MEYSIIGGGLSGCECALVLAQNGHKVTLYEQKPLKFTEAHTSSFLGELVCSNSLRSNDSFGSGVGLLKEEMRKLGSPLIEIADSVQVPAGSALAVDRDLFAQAITQRIIDNPHIQLVEREILSIDEIEYNMDKPLIIAAGPLAGNGLIESINPYIGKEKLYFYDAIAPIVLGSSVDMNFAFFGSRYQKENENSEEVGDYLNCPFNKEEYLTFWQALVNGERVQAQDFEKEIHFEGCMPIEALADRGEKTLTFGTMKPVGFIDPKTGHRPWAIVQLRPENKEGTSYNLVGCQTKLTYKEQDRIFRLIPGLANVEFLRYGSMHRNTFVNAPLVLTENLELKNKKNIYLIGQITGVEGYVESMSTGLWLGLWLVAKAENKLLSLPPQTSALGALLHYLQTEKKHFQPSNAHFGLMPEHGQRIKKVDRKAFLANRGKKDFDEWKTSILPLY